MSRHSWRWMLCALVTAAVLSGCVVSQTRNGSYQFGFIDPGTSVAEFQTANGKARLRRHMDGTWGVRFPDTLSVYRMGRHDQVSLVRTLTVGGTTAALFERRNRQCVDFELLTITRGNVARNLIQPGCGQPVSVNVENDQLVLRTVEQRPMVWAWSPEGLKRGRLQAPPQAPASRTASPAPRRSTPAPPVQPRPRPSAPSPRPTSPPARVSDAVAIPSGSIDVVKLPPTRVTLEKGD